MYSLGIDLGGTNIVASVVDDQYNIISTAKTKTNAPRPANAIFDDVEKVCREAVREAKLTMSDLVAVGMGSPGTCNADGVIEFANNLAFNNVPAREMLRERLGVDNVFVENDANCAALGEAFAGCGNGSKNFVAVTLGTGVGSGIILDGKIVNGVNCAGGECGHMVIMVDGEQCSCGRKGCWEAYASATALIRQTKRAMDDYPDSIMHRLAEEEGGVNGKTAFDAMRLGDIAGIEVVNNYIKYVSCGLINLVNALQPEIICIGGGIKAIKGVGIVTLLSGLALAIPELFISMTIGAELPVMVSSIIIMAVIVLYSRACKTTSNPEYKFDIDTENQKAVSFGEGVKAAMIFILIFVFLVGTSKLFPFINGPLASIKTTVPIYAGPGAKPYTFTWIAVPGVMIFIATILGGLYQGASIGKIAQVFKDNFVGLRFTYLTIIAVVVVAKIMTYSGMTKEIADALVFATGNAYPIVAPFVGGLGAFITGSCTNANVLFGPLQTSVASSLGMSQPWLAGASSLGGCIGKMLSPQSIALGIGAVGAVAEGKEGEVMRGTVGYCLFMLIIAGIITIIAPSVVPFLVN